MIEPLRVVVVKGQSGLYVPDCNDAGPSALGMGCENHSRNGYQRSEDFEIN